ncbi:MULTISPECIES: replication restart helicase PriA [Mesonia]|uniref:Primosomal protein N n=1 Tax=Mesonia oceanica TaxID=2687242 RepID=A0AC61Y7I3_9FLAO|nr:MULTISPECIES: primosomal protein N' [Mesonia]MAN26838.1 primosomal protein N' [Mesonia sp.]MAQ40539.1 primosomal protein N' [Mesonia sp.]MBJ98228.1 primosomal protein N' [Flavobacteriaceae bacterium]VVV00381.1 Primosomal protein N' [Mesonia oceanica]|tara:strand:+ start:51414 stop:53864 length:2451 start_codon:yes stop_codon:yes gene_type:complete
MQAFANVILPLHLDQLFTYQIAEEDIAILKVGMRVAVPFGKSKVYTGVVAKIHHEAPQHYEAKLIEEILDERAIVTKQQLKFWSWIASYYMCAEGEVMKAALPSAFLLESETVVELNKKGEFDEEELTDEEFLIVEALQNQSLLKIHEVMQILEKKTVLPVLNSLVAKNAIIVNQELYKQYKPKLIKYIRLTSAFSGEQKLHELLEELSNAPKQREIILQLFSLQAKLKKPIEKKQLIKESGASASSIKSLIDKAVLEEYTLQKDRVNFEGEVNDIQLHFNEEQQQAYSEIKNHFQNNQVTLLHGVTSSGKTEVYIKLIEEVIAKGKQVLYLLPEIALTTQLISRLQAYFGQEVLVYHSKYSVNERVEVYKHVLHHTKGKIVIGARSSIFLPFQELGLIIIDESHEATFKQYDPAPRYQARDTAVVLANFFKSKLLLGSATPSLESYHNTEVHKYELVKLTKRFGNVLPPKIELVDIKEKHKKRKMTGHFSDRLLEEMKETLAEGKQVILFQNRRGFSPILECNTCGHSPQCPNCDVSLTYHQHNNSLRCHYCGYHMAMQQQCIACGSNDITTKGFGTEQVETELEALFPDHKIGRMDLDTTRGKYGYEKIITAFEQQQIDILVGTQMLTKGLDFRNVDLVGVMNADSLLNFPDFRAHERSFQLLLQVAGRAGRTKERGKVLIQTYNPYHQILQQVSSNNYEAMYKEQMDDRYNFKYPPYYRLIKLTLKGRDYNMVNEASSWLAKALAQAFHDHVLGPEFPPVARIRNEYYKNIIIKIPPKNSLQKTKDYLQKVLKSYQSIANYRKIRVIINVDPY